MDEDRAAAFAHAARARRVRASLCNNVATDERTLEAALADPDAADVKISALLEAVPGFGKVRTQRVLDRLGLHEATRAGVLDDATRERLVRAVAEDAQQGHYLSVDHRRRVRYEKELAEPAPPVAAAPASEPASRHGRVLVLAGPSGVGKGTLVSRLRERHPEIRWSVSATTRPRRANEEDGRDYHFISEAEFGDRVARGEFLEHADVFGQWKGTPRAPLEAWLAAGDTVLLELDVQGALAVADAIPDAELYFLTPPSIEVLERRLRGRGDTPEDQVQRRLDAARREIEIANEGRFKVVEYRGTPDDGLALLEGVLGI